MTDSDRPTVIQTLKDRLTDKKTLKKPIRAMNKKTRLDTRPSVADWWAGPEMRVFPLFNLSVVDGWTDGPTDRPTDGKTDGRTKPGSGSRSRYLYI